MTQNGSSFPGRPRGRRARPENDVPEWAGYDAVQDQREFPDLSPIRGRDARARDGRIQGDWVQDAPLPDGEGYPAAGTGQAPPQAQQPGFQPTVQPTSSQQATAPPTAPTASTGPTGPTGPTAQGEPDWTGAADGDPMGAFSERWRRRGSVSRGERRADRRKRRRLYVIGGAAGAVVIAVAIYFVTSGGGGNPAGVGLGSLITSFLPGEVQQVPNACSAVPSGTLSQYLPGQLKIAAPPLNSGANSQCTWTLDNAPTYRVLEVNIQAYSPSGLASGDGSATFAAIDAYAEDEQAKQTPGPRSGQPKATVSDLSGMPGGNDTVAFQAAQVFNVNGAITDVSTVVVRYRNVIVTVVMNGLDQANKGKYGPVSPSQLSSAAQTVAQQVTGKLVH